MSVRTVVLSVRRVVVQVHVGAMIQITKLECSKKKKTWELSSACRRAECSLNKKKNARNVSCEGLCLQQVTDPAAPEVLHHVLSSAVASFRGACRRHCWRGSNKAEQRTSITIDVARASRRKHRQPRGLGLLFPTLGTSGSSPCRHYHSFCGDQDPRRSVCMSGEHLDALDPTRAQVTKSALDLTSQWVTTWES